MTIQEESIIKVRSMVAPHAHPADFGSCESFQNMLPPKTMDKAGQTALIVALALVLLYAWCVWSVRAYWHRCWWAPKSKEEEAAAEGDVVPNALDFSTRKLKANNKKRRVKVLLLPKPNPRLIQLPSSTSAEVLDWGKATRFRTMRLCVSSKVKQTSEVDEKNCFIVKTARSSQNKPNVALMLRTRRIAAMLQHCRERNVPGIVPLLCKFEVAHHGLTAGSMPDKVFKLPGTIHMVFPFYSGLSLHKHFTSTRRRGMGVESARHLSGQLLLIVQALHNAGIAHRDLKPKNLCFSKEGQLGLIDFGCAIWLMEDEQGEGEVSDKGKKGKKSKQGKKKQETLVGEAMDSESVQTGKHVTTGLPPGTVTHMPPECLRLVQGSLQTTAPSREDKNGSEDKSGAEGGLAMQDVQNGSKPPVAYLKVGHEGNIDPEAGDWWALGCTLYTMLTGRNLFHGRDLQSVVSAVLDWDRQIPVIVRDEAARALLTELLDTDPEARIANGRRAHLHPFFSSLPWVAAGDFGASLATIPAEIKVLAGNAHQFAMDQVHQGFNELFSVKQEEKQPVTVDEEKLNEGGADEENEVEKHPVEVHVEADGIHGSPAQQVRQVGHSADADGAVGENDFASPPEPVREDDFASPPEPVREDDFASN
eukprot:g64939.t1